MSFETNTCSACLKNNVNIEILPRNDSTLLGSLVNCCPSMTNMLTVNDIIELVSRIESSHVRVHRDSDKYIYILITCDKKCIIIQML